MRNMSFSLTTAQVRKRTKTVTRRFGWFDLKVGELLMAVEKAQGLKKGERIKRLGTIRVVSVRKEPISAITASDVLAEGFPWLSPADFVNMFIKHHRHATTRSVVTRIEFEYIKTLGGSTL
jgi:hypothetical protein